VLFFTAFPDEIENFLSFLFFYIVLISIMSREVSEDIANEHTPLRGFGSKSGSRSGSGSGSRSSSNTCYSEPLKSSLPTACSNSRADWSTNLVLLFSMELHS
jgi:hypothetical protein